jgi:hypothetical protein
LRNVQRPVVDPSAQHLGEDRANFFRHAGYDPA